MHARDLSARFLSPPRTPVSPAASAVLTRARRSMLATKAGRLTLYRWGDDGPLALLVHGWSGNAGHMAGFVDPLLARAYRVVAFDLPAHGASTGTVAHLPLVAQAVAEVARALRGVEVAIGHSVGATALALAARQRTPVARMALVAPATSVATSAHRFFDAAGAGDELRAEYLAEVEAIAGQKLDDLELRVLAPGVSVPALVIHDEEDDLFPVGEALAAADAFPAAWIALTSGLGHRRILGHPEVIEEAVAFVDRLVDDADGAQERPRARLRRLGAPVAWRAA